MYEKIFFNKIKIITVAKVGSANFFYCKYDQTTNIEHSHNLLNLNNILKNESNCLIIVGIRNPIDRNLSYLFQTFTNKNHNDVKIKTNGYKGEIGYIHEMNTYIHSIKPEKVIDLYFKQNYHNTFNEWFEEFLEITHITHFDKNKGLDFYNFSNNTLMIYTLEKLNENKNTLINKLGITHWSEYANNSNRRFYITLYNQVKDLIKYKKEYLNNLLDTKIMHLFYNDSCIKYFYSKYKITS